MIGTREVDPLTDEDATATLVALVTLLDESGCPAAVITDASEEGVSISLHFSADRAHNLIERMR